MAALLSRIPGTGVGVERIVLGLDHARPRARCACSRSSGRRTGRRPPRARRPAARRCPRSAAGWSARRPRRGSARSATFASAVAWWTIASGSRLEHGLAHCPGVEQIERDRLRAQRPYAFGACRATCRCRSPRALLDQLGNEPGADRSACSGDEDSHRVLLSLSGYHAEPRHIEWSARVYRYDPTRRRDVTDGRARLAGAALRGAPNPPAGGRLPDARLAQRGRRRRPGGLAAAQPHRRGRDREPRRLADDGGRARVAEHAALAPVAPRGATRRPACPSRSSTAPTGPTPSTRRCSPTRSAWRCSWCSRRCPRPSGSRSVRNDRRAAGGFARGLESEGALAHQQEAPRGGRPGARQSRRCIVRHLRTALGATDASLGDTRVRAARLPRGRSRPRATRRKGGRT